MSYLTYIFLYYKVYCLLLGTSLRRHLKKPTYATNMNLDQKQITQLIIETLARQWGLANNDEEGLLSMIKLDHEYRRKHLKKSATTLLVLGVTFFSFWISAWILALMGTAISCFVFWELYKMPYPGNDRWHAFMYRWRQVTKNIDKCFEFRQVVCFASSWQGTTTSAKDLSEKIQGDTQFFPTLFNIVNIPFCEERRYGVEMTAE